METRPGGTRRSGIGFATKATLVNIFERIITPDTEATLALTWQSIQKDQNNAFQNQKQKKKEEWITMTAAFVYFLVHSSYTLQ